MEYLNLIHSGIAATLINRKERWHQLKKKQRLNLDTTFDPLWTTWLLNHVK